MNTTKMSSTSSLAEPVQGAHTGSAAYQVTQFTERIKSITSHLQTHRKDYASQRGLMGLVHGRKKQLAYLRKKDPEQHHALCQALGIRK